MEASSSGPFSLSLPLPRLSLSYILRSSRTPADAHKRRAPECAAPRRSARRACRWQRSRRLSSDSSLGAAWGYYHSLGFLLALNTKQITPATLPFSVSLSACFSSNPQTLQPHTLQSLAMFLFSSFQSVDLQPCGQL